jgi:FMN phosphatase YigB (HAD superfamily)
MKSIIFDLDDTLYVNKELRTEREKAIIDYLGDRKEEYYELKKEMSTLSSLNKLGISKKEFYDIINSLPIIIEKDERLIKLFSELKIQYNLVVLSNNSRFSIITVLKMLGIYDLIDKFYSAEDFKEYKPAEECFFMIKEGDIVVGNNFEKDLKIPKQKGALTVLVSNKGGFGEDFAIKEIYRLKEVINEKSK